MKKYYIGISILCLFTLSFLSACNIENNNNESVSFDIEEVFVENSKEQKWENYNEQILETELIKIDGISDVSIDITFDENNKAVSANISLKTTSTIKEDMEQTVIDYLAESLNLEEEMITIENITES